MSKSGSTETQSARHQVDPPASVVALASGSDLAAVWVNDVGGITFRLGSGADQRFVKWTPTESGIDLGQEKARLAWGSRFIPVARVLDEGSDEEGSWLLLSPINGETAVANRWLAEPATAVRAIGRGLRTLHDRLPVADCPFTWSAEDRVANARHRGAEGALTPRSWDPEHRHLSPEEALALVAHPPAVDRLVVCHGDACAPNTLLDATGEVAGYVDLGALGLADRWADLAVATWSTRWNYGPGWEDELLAAYGASPDQERIAYYRLLWDLGP